MMSKTSTLTIRLEPTLKKQTEEILEDLGLTPSQAITLFFKQIRYRQGLPFEVSIPRDPNEETLQALEDTKDGTKLHKVDSVEALFQELNQ
jgi:DNA-damage-inducible protein J